MTPEQRSFDDSGSPYVSPYSTSEWPTVGETNVPTFRAQGDERLNDHVHPASTRGNPPPPPHHRAYVEESPELLRWRADLLLDEMMLGGVDVSAADHSPAAYAAVPRPRRPVGDDSAHNDPVRPVEESRPAMPATPPPAPRPPMPSSLPASLTSAYPELDAPATKPWGQVENTPPLPPVVSSPQPTASGEPQARRERLHSLEQRYEQYRREQEATIQPAPPKPAPTMPAAEPPRNPAPKPTPPEDDPTHWAESPEKWLRQDFNPTPEPPVELPPAFTAAGTVFQRPDYGDAAVRQDPAYFVNAMSVMGGKKRSNLLPRMSTLDVEAVNREIGELHAEIADLLPAGHEASERARHLLDKAHTILNSDPMRSAEVEYYMQQVRTIVQRRRQARAWSDLYRSRLRVYLLGWFGLSLVLFLARYAFQAQLEALAVGVFGVAPDGIIVHHWASLIGTGAAGALGGAAGALYTMTQHARFDHGLFDRKYGLRGLMLPIIGLVVGLLGYTLFGLVFGLAGINPAVNLIAGALPALAAFAFGYAQESIYGTRS